MVTFKSTAKEVSFERANHRISILIGRFKIVCLDDIGYGESSAICSDQSRKTKID